MEWNELSKKEKQSFSEADVCRISITPSIHYANWDSITQIRIVAKVDELFKLCDQLKMIITSAQTTKINLADTLVKEINR